MELCIRLILCIYKRKYLLRINNFYKSDLNNVNSWIVLGANNKFTKMVTSYPFAAVFHLS